jgi:hypothetical protein
MKRNLLALAVATLAAAPGASLADKWTVSCSAATLSAREKGAAVPYEVLAVKRFVLKVDVAARNCAIESIEAAFTKGKSAPVSLKADADAKCTLNVTNKGRVFMDARATLKASNVLASPILTVNYEVRKPPPVAGSSDSMGKYFVISGFPTYKPKSGQFDKDAKAACAQAS